MQLKALFYEMLDPVDGVQLTSKRHRLRTYPDCFHGYELMAWLVECDKVEDQHQALTICQAMQDAHYVRCLTDSNTSSFYNDYTLYQFRELSRAEEKVGQHHVKGLSICPEIVEDLPGWVQELEQSDLNRTCLCCKLCVEFSNYYISFSYNNSR